MAKGVHYNIDNIDNRNNKENIEQMSNGFLTSSIGVVTDVTPSHEADHLSSGQKEEGALPSIGIIQPTPLCENDVKRALTQLFDNGETSSQRYKLKVGIDLVNGERVEFIASLTKDMRNFKKYIPEDSRELILKIANEYRKSIKAKHQTYPYLGKFHMNMGRGRNIHSQVEPNTIAIVWYNAEERGWSGALMIYDWVYEFDLFDDYVNEKQKKTGLKCQDIWKNPKHDNTERPLTWAQLRAQKQK